MTVNIEIPYIMGDGTGEDIWGASKEIFEEAVIKATGGKKRIQWIPLLAGIKALDTSGILLPEKTVQEIERCRIAIKGPLTTPVGSGFRSVNVYLRQIFDLYVCMRPIRYIAGFPSPVKKPERIDLIIFRENTEDLYRGIEWQEGTEETKRFKEFLKKEMDISLSDDTGIGLKPISRSGTRRFTKWVIDYAIKHKRKSITVVHKGNIMKYTEGAFKEWAYEVGREYSEYITFNGEKGKIHFNDRIADNMFMQVILRPEEYDILLCPNLNGDYLSDACAALIGGLGVAPGANIGDKVAIFEPTHGSAPKYAGKDVVNPISFLLSGAMLFSHIGIEEASARIEHAIRTTVNEGIVTYDLARQMEGISPVACSTFGKEVKKRL